MALKNVLQELFRVFEILLKLFLLLETFDTAERDFVLFSLFLFPHYSLVVVRRNCGCRRNIIMNTFTAKNEKETQSLLSQNEEGEKKKTTSAKKNVFLTVGGLAAVGI